jgi:exodeoxyribonuclease VII small subunit
MNDELSFEQLYRELEEIVARLEVGDLTLADALALFERGVSLAERCNQLLDTAELRVRQLIVVGAGELSVHQFAGWENG